MAESMFEPTLTEHGSNGQAATKPGDEDLSRFLEDTLGSVLRSARESAAEMMDRAKRAAEDEVSRTGQLHAAAQAEVERMTAWRARVDPLVRDANDRAEAIQRAVADVPGRVADALAPVNDALADMDHVMARLTDALRPPTDRGPFGPDGGSRSSVPVADLPVEPAVDEAVTVGEQVDTERSLDVPAATVDGSGDPDADAAVDVEDTAVADASAGPATTERSEQAGPEAAAAGTDGHEIQDADPRAELATSEAPAPTGPAPLATPSRWVDWSVNGNGPTPVAGPTAMISNGADGPETSDDDEMGLRSATSQLRRAVTDIDWNDLPSASHG